MYQNNIFEPVIHADASQILASSSFYSYRWSPTSPCFFNALASKTDVGWCFVLNVSYYFHQKYWIPLPIFKLRCAYTQLPNTSSIDSKRVADENGLNIVVLISRSSSPCKFSSVSIPVQRITFARGAKSLMDLIRVGPSITGMAKSVMTKSISDIRFVKMERASAPLQAERTSYPFASSRMVVDVMMCSSSSTQRMSFLAWFGSGFFALSVVLLCHELLWDVGK